MTKGKDSVAQTPGAEPAKDEKGTAAAATKTKKGFDYETLTKLVNQRSNLENHLDQLAKRKSTVDFMDSETTEDNQLISIELNFGSRHNGYAVKNANLLLEVTNFLENKIREKIQILEAEIEVITSLN